MSRHAAPRTDATTSGTVARHGRLRSTNGVRSVVKGISMALGVMLASSLIFGGIVWWNLQSGVQTFEVADSSNIAEFEGGVNILLVGSDDRTGQGAEFGEGEEEAAGVLNDVTMLFHLAEDHSHATVVSIPRDTLVDTPECTSDTGEVIPAQEQVMFNSILGPGGMPCVIAATEEISGLDIQFAAMVQFRGVIEMSNAVGGVEVCVEQPIDDPAVGLTLDAGYHTIKGEEALKFLRTRHGVGDGSDLSRISNQQVFLSALMRTVKGGDTLSNPTKLYGLARSATQNMTLSSNLNNLDTLVSLAAALSNVPLDNIAFVRLPVVDSEWYEGKVEPDPVNAEAMWQLLRNDQQPSVQADPSVADPNATDAPTDAPVDPTEDGTIAEEPTNPTLTDPEIGPTAMPTTMPTLDGQTAADETCSNSNDALF